MALRAVLPSADGGADDDRIVERTARPPMRWSGVLLWFMRIVAAIWIAKGLVAWATILGVTRVPPPFEMRATGYQATMVYFSVIDLVAAVGLWLTSTWGGVLWLIAVMSHLILAVFFPRFVSNSPLTLGLLIAAIMIYLTASWLAALEE